MRLFIMSIFFLMLCGCAIKDKNDKIFIIPVCKKSGSIKLDLDTLKERIIFSDAFWNHFTSTFPTASLTIFGEAKYKGNNTVQITDSTYLCGLISFENQIFLRNCLPKNLSKEESDSYREGLGFFIIPHLDTSTNQRKPEVSLEKHWSMASEQVEREYLQFLSLVEDYGETYAVVVKKTLVDSILSKYL